MIRRVLIVCGLAAILGMVGWEVSSKERLLATGETVLLALAPKDPRSLIQGDYMTLDYAIARSWPQDASWPREGALIVSADEFGVAQFQRLDRGEPLVSGEHRLTYRIRNNRLQIGTTAFYFQEGTADTWAGARYGEFRVAPDGTSLLMGLRDADRRRIGTR